jgi:PPM family protein phosphatase
VPSSVLTAHGQSHTGNVRKDNQDSIRLFDPQDDAALHEHGPLYGVADGMGGYEHGGVASALALETFFNTFYGGASSKSLQNIRQGIQTANLAVYQAAQRMGARMGTTLSAINIVGNQLHIAHIGDSRIYLVREGKAVCLTNDHTVVGELVRMRVLSPDKVRNHARRSILEKSLGMDLFVQPDVTSHALREDDYLIVCTDGVWAYIEDDEFSEIALDIREPEQISQTLINLAMQRESDDNVSALVIHALQLAPAPAETPRTSFAHFVLGRLMGKG